MSLINVRAFRAPKGRQAFRTFRPTVKSLECRQLLSVTAGAGVVIPHVQVETVYYGQDWNKDSFQGDITDFDTFLNTIVGSSYMSMLGEYGVGLGSWTGHDVVSDANSPLGLNDQNLPTNTFLGEQQVQDMLTSEIDGGRIPLPDTSTLYVVVVPQGITLPNGWAGYHNAFTYSHTNYLQTVYGPIPVRSYTSRVAYAVIGDNATDLTLFQQQTVTASHELAEAVTDPDGQGWRDYTHTPAGDWWEIGDGDLDGVTSAFAGYTVQEVWLNSMNAGFAPASDAVSQYGTDPFALGQPTIQSFDGKAYFEATASYAVIGQTTFRNWEIAPGDYSGWFPVSNYVPEYVDGPNPAWDWELSVSALSVLPSVDSASVSESPAFLLEAGNPGQIVPATDTTANQNVLAQDDSLGTLDADVFALGAVPADAVDTTMLYQSGPILIPGDPFFASGFLFSSLSANRFLL